MEALAIVLAILTVALTTNAGYGDSIADRWYVLLTAAGALSCGIYVAVAG